jgi:hypothetical protein
VPFRFVGQLASTSPATACISRSGARRLVSAQPVPRVRLSSAARLLILPHADGAMVRAAAVISATSLVALLSTRHNGA